MSTLPHDSISAVEHAATVMPAALDDGKLDKAVKTFELLAEELDIPRPSREQLRGLCEQVAALSAEVFSEEMNIEVRSDPEISGELHFTFDVVGTGSVDELVAKSNEWHVRLRRSVGDHAELFCLSVDGP